MKYSSFISGITVFTVSVGYRNTGNPNDTGGPEVNEPIRSEYGSGNGPSNTSNTAVTDSTAVDSTDYR